MRKIKAALLALLVVMSTACSSGEKPKNGSSMPKSDNKAESSASEFQSDEAVMTSETGTEDSSEYDKDDLIRDIIAEYARDPDGILRKSYYGNGKYLTWTVRYGCSVLYDVNSGTYDTFPASVYYCNGSLYSISKAISSDYLYGDLCLTKYDLDGNVIDTYSLDDMAYHFYVLSDGRIILTTFSHAENAKFDYYVLSADMKTCEKLKQVKTVGGAYSDITKILTVFNDELYCHTVDNYRCIVNMNTGDVRPMNDEMGGELFRFDVQGYDKYIGKYVKDEVGNVYDIVSGRKYENVFEDYLLEFVTEKSFYYTVYNGKNSRALYRYDPDGNDEMIFDGASEYTEFYGVNDDYLTVMENDNIFIINMNTREKTKITLPKKD